jgi:hypothetical protein
MSLNEKVAALPKKNPEFVENTNGKLGYMGVESKGENKIEFQRIGPAVSGGSFIRLAAQPDGNCFFSSLLLSTRKPTIGFTLEGKIEFTRLFREWYMTPEIIKTLKEKAATFLKSVSSENMEAAQESIIEDAFEGVEKDKEYTDILLAMLISDDIAPGYTAIFLNATNGDPKVPTIPKEQCMYNLQNENQVILFMYYGNHFEPIFFLRDNGIRKSIFVKNDPELKPIFAMLEEACKREDTVEKEENAELVAAIAASMEQAQGKENLVTAQQAIGGGGSAAAPAPAPAPAAAAAPAASAAAEPSEEVKKVEAIVSAFVEQHKATWASKSKTFLHKGEKHTTAERSLEERFKNPLIPMEGFKVKSCRGTNNDCIINSLLTCLSPTFRRLEGEFKDKVASYYRYENLLPMYRLYKSKQNFTGEAEKKAKSIEAEIRSGKDAYTKDKAKVQKGGYGGRPISAEVAAAFGITYGISVLIKESEAREQGAFSLLGSQPAAPTFIIIHNMDGVHYSSISDSADNYLFNIDMIRPWIAASEKKGHKETKTKCQFITDQVLRRDGKLYIVVNAENTDDAKGCKFIYIHELDGGDVNEYKKDIQNILLIKKILSPPTFSDPDENDYSLDVERAKALEWEGVKAGAQRGLDTLKKKYPIFKKKYNTYEEVYADATTLPFIDINGKEGYELANPAVHDAYGLPSTYVEFMAAGGIQEVETLAAGEVDSSSKRKSSFRKTRKKLSHTV